MDCLFKKAIIHYFDTVKNLALKKDTILLQQSRQNNQVAITLLSPTLKKNVQLATNISGEFSDNYFDLMPNQTQVIYFKPSQLLSLESIPLTTKFIYNKESKK
jgi:beta-mannosidase